MPYLGIIFLLIIGLVLPFPEDLTLILAGQLVHSEELNFWLMLGVCFIGVIPTDFVLYYVGKKYGRTVWRYRFVRRIFTPKRRVQVVDQFTKHGDKVVWVARFIGGFRAPVFITAGMLGMSPKRFLFLDGLASLVSIPLFVGGTYYLGQRFSQGAHQVAHEMTKYLMILIGIIFIGALIKGILRSKKEIMVAPPTNNDE